MQQGEMLYEMRDEAGNWMTVTIAFPGRTLWARVWKCQVGRTDLYLLDACLLYTSRCV